MAGSKPLVRQGGRTQQGNIGIGAVTGLSSELGTKVSDNDPRLSDSREWAATTVTQAEAEAGTASTRRAWTAQRVRQAINAWWQLVTSGFGRNFIAASNEQAARNVLQLGTAATKNVGTSSGNVMEVGAFGLGKSVALDPDVVLDTYTTTGKFYQPLSSRALPALNYPYQAAGELDVYRDVTTTHQTYTTYSSNKKFIRTARNTAATLWTDWAELIHTGNILSSPANPRPSLLCTHWQSRYTPRKGLKTA